MGTAQIGATISSAKKKASDRQMAETARLWIRTTGRKHRQAPMKPATMTLRRANTTLPLRRRIASLMTPPRLSPTTPPKNTPVA